MPKQSGAKTWEEEIRQKEQRASRKQKVTEARVGIWRRGYVDPGPRIEWKPFPGELRPWQKRFEAWLQEGIREKKHGVVLCTPPGLGKSRVVAKLVAACDSDRPKMVVMPGDITERWKEFLVMEGVDSAKIIHLRADTDPRTITQGSVLVASLEAFTSRDPRCLPVLALLVIDERKNIGQGRAAMLARVDCAHVVSISADPPNGVGCWILGGGRRPDNLVYKRDMFVVDTDEELPPLRITPVPLKATLPDYAKALIDAWQYLHVFNDYSTRWWKIKVAQAIRDALTSGNKTIIYTDAPAPEIHKVRAPIFEELGADPGDFAIVDASITPPRREALFDKLRAPGKCPTVCFVPSSVARVGIDLSFFDVIALCQPVYSAAAFAQIAGRIRRFGAAEKEVRIYYGEGTHEVLLLDRRYYEQLPGEPLGCLLDWVRDWVENEKALQAEADGGGSGAGQ